MKTRLKSMLIFLIILSVLTISTANASDINLDANTNDNPSLANALKIGEINDLSENTNGNLDLDKIESNYNDSNANQKANNDNEDNDKVSDSNQEIAKNTVSDNSQEIAKNTISDNSQEMAKNTVSDNSQEIAKNTISDNSQEINNQIPNSNPILNDKEANTNPSPLKDPNDENLNNASNNGTGNSTNNSTAENESTVKIKSSPIISIKTTQLKSRDTLIIYLKDSDNNPLSYKTLNIELDDVIYSVRTNAEGIGQLNLLLTPGSHGLNIQFEEDDDYNSSQKEYTLHVSKLGTKIKTYANYVVRKNRLYIYLLGADWKGIPNRQVIVKYRKKTYKLRTNKNGRVSIKIRAPLGRYKVTVKFKGDEYFKKSSKSFKFYVVRSTHFNLANRKILTRGYIRIYLHDKTRKAIKYKKMTIRIGSNIFKKKTNSEGRIVFRVDLPIRNYTVTVKYGKLSVNKRLECINDTVKDPMKYNISTVGGAPDTDYMPGSYVMADGSATYTLKRSQYKAVMKRDSYCLFLNNRLSKYVVFSTKYRPKTNYIIKRTKWNVIEREINRKVVKKYRLNYWPGSVKVSLKGRSYIYPEVRDVQNTGYTCGPASASVCSQVLKNYVSEKKFARLSGTNREGTKIPRLYKTLKKLHFTTVYFDKYSFKVCLNELKKGGSAAIFHANNHYVSILDISKNGKKVLVSNSYKTYDGIPTGWVSTAKMNRKFGHFHDSLVIKLNYTLSDSNRNSANCYYNSMGRNWNKHGPRATIGRV